MSTLKQLIVFFANFRLVSLILAGAFLPVLSLAAQPSQASHCRGSESVFFSCRLQGGGQTVSLCASPEKAPFNYVTYRYGYGKRTELTFVSSIETKNRFYATVAPVAPRATVREVWFDRKQTRYIVTACVGGDCPLRAGLLVYRNNRLVMRQGCDVDNKSHAWFSSSVLAFGDALESSHSNTELIQLQDAENDLTPLYPWRQEN